MKNLFLPTLLSSFLLTTSAFSIELTKPEHIYAKKCAMCHKINKNDLPYSPAVAPSLNTAMKNVMIGIDLIEEPKDTEAFHKRTIEYLKDYFFNPEQSKSYCEDISFEKFGTMPSMKGFMTKKQLDIIVPWIVENHKITINDEGNYIDQNGVTLK